MCQPHDTRLSCERNDVNAVATSASASSPRPIATLSQLMYSPRRWIGAYSEMKVFSVWRG
jgi:hypothetical protein